MARPREMQDGKKTEPFTIRFVEGEAMQIYRLAAELDIQPAVLIRRWARLGMAASSRRHHADENESSSDFATLGDAP